VSTFAIPHVVFIHMEERWWRLRPSQLRHLARAALMGKITPGLLSRWITSCGRLIPPPPAEVQLRAGVAVLAPAGWGPAEWHAALDALDLRDERFAWDAVEFDIPKAKALAVQGRNPVRQAIPVEAWWAGARGRIRVRSVRVEEVRQDRPLIFATLVDAEGPFRILIDGNHRATRALQAQTAVPYVVLSMRQTLRCMSRAPVGYRVRRQMAAYCRGVPGKS